MYFREAQDHTGVRTQHGIHHVTTIGTTHDCCAPGVGERAVYIEYQRFKLGHVTQPLH